MQLFISVDKKKKKKREVFEGYGAWSCFAADTAQMGIRTS